jgi:hypothetical protein
LNIVSPIVKAYSEGVTSEVSRDLSDISDMSLDVDRQGSTWGDIATEVATWACVHGVVATVVDTPNQSTEGISEAERIARKIQPYVVVVHPTSWIDAVVRDGRLVEFSYLTPVDSDTGNQRAMRWVANDGWYLHDWNGAGFSHTNLVRSGKLPSVLGGQLPVTFAYYERDSTSAIPLGLPLIQDAATTGRLINNMISWVSEIDRNASFPFLAVPSASTGGVLDRSVRIQVGPQRALGVDSKAGLPTWVEPSGNSQRSLREQCVFLFNWTYRSVGMEISVDSGSGVQSGEALRIRSRDFESRALRFAHRMQSWELATLRLFSKLAGRTGEISVQYPKRITLKIPSEELTRALQLLSAPTEIGPHARVQAVSQAVKAALTLTDEQYSEISDEVRTIYQKDLEAELSLQGAAKAEADSKTAQLTQPSTVPASNEVISGAQFNAVLDAGKAAAEGSVSVDFARILVASTFGNLIESQQVDQMFDSLRGFSNSNASTDTQNGAIVAPVIKEPKTGDEA